MIFQASQIGKIEDHDQNMKKIIIRIR